MKRASFTRDERGVSTVVGAMLIFAIGIVLMATMRTSIVPTQEADAEAAHMRALSQQLVHLRSDLQRQVVRDSPGDLVHSLQMSRQRIGIFDSGQKADRIGLVFPDQRITISSAQPVLVEDPSSGATEQWVGATTQPSISGIKDVQSLRVHFPALDKTNTGQSLRIDVYNSTNAYRGAIVVAVENDPDLNYYVRIYTYDATGGPAPTPVNKQSHAYHNSAGQTDYFLDLLDPALRFDRVLDSAQVPFRLTVTSSIVPVPRYAIQYIAYTANGAGVPLGGGGLQYATYSRDFRTGFLEYDATNRHFVNQIYRFEHGALVLNQASGSVFRVDPELRIDSIGGVIGIQATVPSLRGEARTLASGATATVRTAIIDTTDVTLQARSLTITVQTKHPNLWAAYLEKQLVGAGLSSIPGPLTLPAQYVLASNANSVTATINGLLPDPLDPTYDVRLIMHQANVNVKLNP